MLRSIYLIAFAVLVSAYSHSAEREFRVNPDAVDGGYAIAWGIPGEKIDFEAIDAQGHEASSQFIVDRISSIQNYVVDLQTNSILHTLPVDEYLSVDGCFYSICFGNHYSVSLFKIPTWNDKDVVFVIAEYKWDNLVREALIIDRNQPSLRVVGIQSDVQEQIVSQVRALLPADELKRFDGRAKNIFFTRDNWIEDGEAKYVIEAYIPKNHHPDDYLYVAGELKIDLIDNNVRVKVLSARVSDEESLWEMK